MFVSCVPTSTVGSLILRNRFLQIALKLLNTLLCNFAACNHTEIVRFVYNRFFLITLDLGKYSSGRGPLYPIGNVQVIYVMRKHLSIMIVTKIYASGLRQTNNSRNRAESKVKVTKKVIKCKKLNVTILNSMPHTNFNHRLFYNIF